MELGWSHGQIQDLPYSEYVRWRAFMVWRHAQQSHQADVMASRVKR